MSLRILLPSCSKNLRQYSGILILLVNKSTMLQISKLFVFFFIDYIYFLQSWGLIYSITLSRASGNILLLNTSTGTVAHITPLSHPKQMLSKDCGNTDLLSVDISPMFLRFYNYSILAFIGIQQIKLCN